MKSASSTTTSHQTELKVLKSFSAAVPLCFAGLHGEELGRRSFADKLKHM